MVELVQKLALQDSFDARGVFVPAGHLGTFDADKITAKDKHLIDPGDVGAPAMVEIAAIAPTGPNPTMPQQLPPDAVQTPGGGYVVPGKVLVGEVTAPAEERIDDRGLGDKDREAEVSEALAEAAETAGVAVGPATATATVENNDDALVAGTVKEVTAELGTKTDEQIDQMIAAEKDREKPRTGVLNALEAEQAARKERVEA